LLLQRAIPEALKKAQPGSKAFRGALRDALENSKDVPASNGVFSISAGDHNGMDNRARVIVSIENGKWVLVK
jgi:branched-chain amino acid transport system substrate-binding protein